jgi:trk system potassium uptake protein TrkA
VITPEVLVTNFIKRVVEQPGVEQIFEFDNGLMQLVETKAHAGLALKYLDMKLAHKWF